MATNRNSSEPLPPLVVDLDGTLIKTDLFFESISQFITRHPLRFGSILKWLSKGRSQLKFQLALNYKFDASSLPYNRKLISWLSEQHLLGRKIVLATAAHKILAQGVANHLRFFDEVLATEGKINLKANNKRDLLVAKYGERGFDYIGNDIADFTVWKASNAAYVVSSSTAFIERVSQIGNLTKSFPTEKPNLIKSLVKSLRPHQWFKNILIFVPLLTAQRIGDLTSDIEALIAFVVFGLTASSVYLLNDIVDIENDRHHQLKQYRPFAAGNLSLITGWLIWPLLLLAALGLAYYKLSTAYVAVLVIYFLITIAYTLLLKQIAILDILTLASLYTLRIVAGAAAISVPLSFWLLTFSMFIFFSLALVKRFSELKSMQEKNIEGPLRGRNYEHKDLEIVTTMGISSGYLSVLVLALYIQDGHTTGLYRYPELIWFGCPILLFWISRVWLITYRGHMHHDPIIFALKDRVSIYLGFILVMLYAINGIGL